MKKIILILFTAALALSVSVCGYADDVSKFDCKNYSGFFDADEFVEVNKQISGDYFINEIKSLEPRSAAKYSVNSTSEPLAYKVYDITSIDFLDKLSEGAKVSDLLPESYSWIIPGESTVAKVIADEEKGWTTVGYKIISHRDPDDVVKSNVVKFDVVNSAVERIRLKDRSEITDVVCVQFVGAFTYFVCITLTDKTYLIPFGSRPDFTGLENGALYLPNEAEDILKKYMPEIFEEVDLNADPLEMRIGGAGFEMWNPVEETNAPAESRKAVPLFLLVLICAAVIAGGITAAVLIWDRKSKHKR